MTEWDLSIGGVEVWRGSIGYSPTVTTIKNMLSTDHDEELITDLTCKIIKYGDRSTFEDLLTILACNYWRPDGDLDPSKIKNIPHAHSQSVCGFLFKKGSVVWTCRQCAKDPTCVLCDECFKNSNHDGHEVYFHRSTGAGGSCDCGDPEAWKESGFCHSHCLKESNINPLTVVPMELYRGLRAVFRGIMGFIISYVTSCTRGFDNWTNNIYVQDLNAASSACAKLVLRLHNDDVHTYDDVTGALTSISIPTSRARELTLNVDKNGHAVVKSGARNSLKIPHDRLQAVGLLVSVTPEIVLNNDARVVELLTWLLKLGQGNDGLQRAVVDGFLLSTCALPPAADILTGNGITTNTENDYNCNNMIFQDENLFPSVISLIPVKMGVSGANFPDQVRHPFNYCPRDALSVLMMSTPFCSVEVKKAVNDIILTFQHDDIMKRSFTCYLTLLYPSLNTLFNRGIGTAEDTIFNLSVQASAPPLVW